MGEVGPHLVTSETADVGTHDAALRERVEGGHAHAAAQLRVADEDHGEAVLGVHRVVGEQPQILEQLGSQVMSLIDDQHGAEAVLRAEPG